MRWGQEMETHGREAEHRIFENRLSHPPEIIVFDVLAGD